MIAKDRFDSLIKQNLVSEIRNDSFGYTLSKRYNNYFTRESFADFVNEIKSDRYHWIFASYDVGKGSELKEQSGRYVKCHEIFDAHHVVMKIKYWDHLFGTDNAFGFPFAPKSDDKKFEISLDTFGILKASTMFDIKQFLCHLIGIASQKDTSEPAKLLYLFFKPKLESVSEQQEIDKVFCELQSEITTIFNSSPIQNFIKKNNITLTALAEYAKTTEKLSRENVVTLFPT